MSRAVVVRYRVKPESLDENIRLVQAVYEELAEAQPEGLGYSTYKVDDRSFVHVAVIEGADNPLNDVAAFLAFSEEVAQRCEDGPLVMHGTLVGVYPAP